MKTRVFLLIIAQVAIGLFFAACDDSKSAGDTDPGDDTGVPDDSDTGPQDTGSETEEESEIPPELPSLCTASVIAENMSGTGDAQIPAVSRISATDAIAAFAYDPQETDSSFHLQLAAFDALAAEYVTATVFEDSVISTRPHLNHNGAVHAVAWLEGRTAWDAGCVAGSVENCHPDVAMATLENGVPLQSTPIRVSTDGTAVGRPSMVPVPTGWLVFWGSEYQGETSVRAALVNDAGEVGTVVNISEDNSADELPQISTAVFNDSVLVLWRSNSQQTLYYRMLDVTGQPQSETMILTEGGLAYGPSAAAGSSGFMVAYGRATQKDAEIFTRQIDPQGAFVGEENRLTYTNTWTRYASLTFVPGSGFAVSWLSDTANGSSTCVDSLCAAKVFATVLNADGSLAATPILISKGANDLNPCRELVIGSNGTQWLAAYEIRRNLRQQVQYSVFSCQ